MHNTTELPYKQIQTHPKTDVEIKMDYKVILESQYVTERMCEIAKKPLEIGFVYGGNVTTKKFDTHTLTTLDMKQIIIPKKQTVSAGNFLFDYDVLPKLDEYFQKQKQIIVGQGHSHQHLPVYHSKIDRDNYKKMSLYCGTKISPHEREMVKSKRTVFESFSKRLGINTSYRRKQRHRVVQKPTYIFPTLVFNTKKQMTAGLAASNTKELTVIEDIPIQYYNKQATLTADDKMRLDKQIYAVLKENNIPFEYAPEKKQDVKHLEMELIT